MASHVVVIDSTFRRATVKTEPGTYISDILEMGCQKLGLKADKYILKHNKKAVDMTRTFRQSGLASGAKLELVQGSRSPAPVAVALQLPESIAAGVPNSRLTETFSSATTFWMVLRKFESGEGRNLNITGRGVAQTDEGMTGPGRVYYEQPVCQVMGRELSTIQDLQKTLASLGFNNGNCMIRLSFRVTSIPLEEAMSEILEYFKSMETPEPAAATTEAPKVEKSEEVNKVTEVDMTDAPETSATTIIEESLPQSSSEPVKPSANTPVVTNTPKNRLMGPGGREVSFFSAPTDSTPRAALQPTTDSDFDPSLAHVKLHSSRIQGESRNKRLPTAAEAQKLAEEKAAKQAAVKSVDIKLRFPDQTTANAKFTSEDTAKDLYDFTKDLLQEGISLEMFNLSSMGDKGMEVIPKGGSEKLIIDLRFTGRVLVNFNWVQEATNDTIRTAPVLKSQYAKNAQDIHIPEVPTIEEEKEEDIKGKGKAVSSAADTGREKKGMPKWFKGLQKK